jgi:hypothetical protein
MISTTRSQSLITTVLFKIKKGTPDKDIKELEKAGKDMVGQIPGTPIFHQTHHTPSSSSY